ncbi:MAG: 2-dehydropantoate 2-reductase [Armatimonadota bacterium]|nr:2-dehydropantoate 2-reductase [Armatimonadota bacterium]
MPLPPVRVAVLGAGGVGGYFGGRLARAGAEVCWVARGVHLEAIRREGLKVRSPAGDFCVRGPATDDPADVGPCDYVLFCVKSYDTESAARLLPPLLHEQTAVLTLQNGVDNPDRIASVVGWRHVMAGAAFVFATVRAPGEVAHTGGPGRVVFGEMDGARSPRGERLLQWFRQAQVPAELVPDIRRVLWDKFAFICAQAGLTAATRLPVGELRDVRETLDLFRRVVEEVCAVAAAEGVPLPPETADRHLEFARRLEPQSTSSLHHDLVHGRRMELEALHGTVVRLARQHGLPAPVCETLYALLKPWALRNERGLRG